MISLILKEKVVKNPLTNAATVVSLKMSKIVSDNILLLSRWKSFTNSPMSNAYALSYGHEEQKKLLR